MDEERKNFKERIPQALDVLVRPYCGARYFRFVIHVRFARNTLQELTRSALAEQIVTELREAATKTPGAIANVIESVRRRVREDCGLCHTRVVSGFVRGVVFHLYAQDL